MVFVQNRWRYAWALLITVFSALILLNFRSDLGASIIAQLFLLPVGVSAAIWGFGPGILAAVGSFILYNFLFIEPYYSLMVHQSRDLISLFVFLIVATVISQLIGQMREKTNLASRRELEAKRLYELSNRLSGAHETQSVIRAVAELIQESLQAQRVEVVYYKGEGEKPALFVAEGSPFNSNPAVLDEKSAPHYLVPLQSARSVIGEMRVWISPANGLDGYQRFLETCAAQASLALERIRLGELDTRARILEESDRLKTALLSSVSHELRTPLATIKASVSSLLEDDLVLDEDARKELLTAVEEETDQLNQLVGNLLSMSRIEAGALELEQQWNELSEIIERVLSRMKLQTHQVRIEIPADLPLVAVDFLLMEQVFTNLVSNSVKFSPENSLITIRAEFVESVVLVRVINQGPPVPEDHLERIFDKFHRITMQDKVTGTGLGLSICKGIVEAHGGKIWAENSSEGFSFVFTIPSTWEDASLRVLEK